MIIYKVINKINGKWYIGKDSKDDPNYYGSGILIRRAIKKYGKENFEKIILEECAESDSDNREKHWIKETNAVNDEASYNLASGGEGGNLSRFIDYKKRGNQSDSFKGAIAWYRGLTEEQKKERHEKQALKRTKGWYVSKVDESTETYVQNIAKWCRENNVDPSAASKLNDPTSPMFQKQTKGWRIRRADTPTLLPYEDKRLVGHSNVACQGKTWRVVDGKRVWFDK